MSRQVVRREPETEFASNLPAILHHIYCGRGINSLEQLDLSLKNLLPPDTFKNIDAAASLLANAVTGNKKILIVADFDADGATSCALMLLALRAMGATAIDYLVPNRFDYGYGLTPEIVRVALADDPDLIVTVDNGISSVDGVNLARENGVSVIITDHHLPPDLLPEADVILNPNQQGCDFPSKSIAGVGVAFYLLSATRKNLRDQGWFRQQKIQEPRMSDYLDLVALGTVADVVSLDYNNRILVNEGIRRIRGGRARPGIMALIQVSNRVAERMQSADLGFSIGPRLNAAGRLKDMSLGIECLVTNDSAKARELAEQLGSLNAERREIEDKMKHEAEKDLSTMVKREEDLPFGLCMYDASWHQGVIGILASRIKDQVYRPVIAFANETHQADSPLKGSARSVTGFHIRDALANIDAMNPGMLNKFGGHAMAAGLSMAKDHFDAFQKAFDAEVRKVLNTSDLLGVIYSDGEVAPGQLNLEFAKLLQEAGPWGQGFSEPVFDGIFEIVDQRIVAEKHLKLKFRSLDSPDVIDAIFFNLGQLQDHRRVRITYQMSINEYRGRESLQFIVSNMEPAN
jgi:single-stranded-DNA-specific exonuclease